jgi:hypothetical protein
MEKHHLWIFKQISKHTTWDTTSRIKYTHIKQHKVAINSQPQGNKNKSGFIMFKSIANPGCNMQLKCQNTQLTARKDMESAFRILQANFSILQETARFWDQKMFWGS